MRVIEVNMERRRNEGAEETGDLRENPPTNGIVRSAGNDKGGTAKPIKRPIASKRMALNWLAVFSSHFVYRLYTCRGNPHLLMAVWVKYHPKFETREAIQMIDRVYVKYNLKIPTCVRNNTLLIAVANELFPWPVRDRGGVVVRLLTEANRDFHPWESCLTMSLVGGFSRESPVSSALAFWRCSIRTPLILVDFQNLAVKAPSEKRRSRKGDTATRIKYAIAAKREALNWRAVFLSHCVILLLEISWENKYLQHSATLIPRKLGEISSLMPGIPTSSPIRDRMILVPNQDPFTPGHMTSIQGPMGSQLASSCTRKIGPALSPHFVQNVPRNKLEQEILVQDRHLEQVWHSSCIVRNVLKDTREQC
ncbi:hypothetical protein PR048_026864 [Dryococelus australis]|uniref:Uncharacterized protein n=1 Tax=Dryococelus australis TaxID=614101 RepID=A0ABQ9GMJ8_9NEOP|nr:hypothetical protein PR048_026864 [Dryococelus australis]